MKLSLLSLKWAITAILLISISGCQFSPFADSYMQHKPQINDLPGTYVLSDQTLNNVHVDELIARNGSKSSPHQLILHSDGTFSMINMPVWAGN